jgi:hypothetical protein
MGFTIKISGWIKARGWVAPRSLYEEDVLREVISCKTALLDGENTRNAVYFVGSPCNTSYFQIDYHGWRVQDGFLRVSSFSTR